MKPSNSAIGKAATLALGVPGISLVIYQVDWPPLYVGRSACSSPRGEVWTHVTPCTLRRELCRPPGEASDLIGPALGAADASVRIVVSTHGSTRFDRAGIFTTSYDDHGSAVGWVSSSAVGPPVAVGVPDGEFEEPTIVRVDEQLGTQLLSWCFPTDDLERASRARKAAFATMLNLTVEELILEAGRPPA